MMLCYKVRKLFSCYLDNELSHADRNSLEEHLMVCHKCSCEMRQLQKTICLVRDVFFSMEEVTLSADFTKRFYQKIRHGSNQG